MGASCSHTNLNPITLSILRVYGYLNQPKSNVGIVDVYFEPSDIKVDGKFKIQTIVHINNLKWMKIVLQS